MGSAVFQQYLYGGTKLQMPLACLVQGHSSSRSHGGGTTPNCLPSYTLNRWQLGRAVANQ